MKKWIVITTINPPTTAIERISDMTQHGWRCVVVGDRKTPASWKSPGIEYLSMQDQIDLFGPLAQDIPANHYCRKNLGYLYAIREGADVILETDDDNIPGPDFGADVSLHISAQKLGGVRWVNVYKHFTQALIWPRGHPLDQIHESGQLDARTETIAAPIQQFLADGDPDVDAIYRMLFKDRVTFDQRPPVWLEQGSWCAFNSQNTMFFREAFPTLYLPCHVSFRMTDIWRSFVAQAALWTQNRHLAFRSATVVQERNEHDLMKDFTDEVPGYLHNEAIISALATIEAMPLDRFVLSAWESLNRLGVVSLQELRLAQSWMDEVRKHL